MSELQLSFLHTRLYFATNGWVILRRARITLLCECLLPWGPLPLVFHHAILSVAFLALICLTWTILFAIFLHHEWSYSSPFQSASVLSKSMSTLLTLRGRVCCCWLAITLCFHHDSLVFNVSFLKPLHDHPRLMLHAGLLYTIVLGGMLDECLGFLLFI